MSTEIVEYSKTDAALADLASRYKGVVFEVATREGMGAAIKARAEVRGYRVDLEKIRVEIKAPALERCRLIDSEAKRINDALEALEDPIDQQIKLEETRKERERAEREAAGLPTIPGGTALTSAMASCTRLMRAARIAREEEDRKARAARAAEAERQAAEDARLRAEREKIEEERREVERQATELMDGKTVLRTFVHRFGRRKEFAPVVKAITEFLREEKAAA